MHVPFLKKQRVSSFLPIHPISHVQLNHPPFRVADSSDVGDIFEAKHTTQGLCMCSGDGTHPRDSTK